MPFAQTQDMYTFELLTPTLQNAYAVQKLGQAKYDEAFFLLFNAEKQAHSLEYMAQIRQKTTEWQSEKRQVYLAKRNEQAVGIVSVCPVRVNEDTQTKECAFDVWAVNDEFALQIINSFRENVQMETKNPSGYTARVFAPMKGESLTVLPYSKRAKGGYSFLTCLSQSMPNRISSQDSAFSLRRLNVSHCDELYQLFENNRAEANQFLIGLSKQCDTPEGTKQLLMKSEQIPTDWPVLDIYYGMYQDNKLCGFCGGKCYPSETHIDILVDNAHSGKGYASEAVRLFERELFKRGMETIKLQCDVQNYGTPTIARRNHYLFDAGDDSDNTYYYHKHITDYVSGAHASKPLLKPNPFQLFLKEYNR